MDENERLEEMGGELLDGLKQIRDLNSSKPDKYDKFKALARERTGSEVAVCYMSDLSRMWTPRVGQALLSLPTGLVLLASDEYDTRSKKGRSYVERIELVVGYIPRLEFVLACTGWEGDWTVAYIVGPEDSEVCSALTRAFPEAEARRVSVAPVYRSVLPGYG